MNRSLVMALALLAALPSGFAHAQDDDEERVESEDLFGDDGSDGDVEGEDGEDLGIVEAGEGEGDGDAPASAAARQWFFGPYFRFVFVPAFMLELFLDEAPTVGNAAFGVAATYRGIDGPSFEIGVGYTGYGFADPFRAKGDPVEDTEWLDSSLGMVHLTGSILWESSIVEDALFFEYGIGLDIGVMTGELVRTEAYFNSASNQYEPCNGPGSPLAAVAYCEQPMNAFAGTDAYDQMGAHYNVVEERVPPVAVLPMLPRLGLRYMALPELAIKAEAAYGIAQIWLGLSAAYAPDL